MKATGIVRRIDDLGRIVLPMEMRRIFKIRDGDSIEIFCTDDGYIMLKKYSLINENVTIANEISKALSSTLDASVAIFDTDKIISVSELSKKDYINSPLSKELSDLFNKHKPVYIGNAKKDESGKYLTVDKPVKVIENSFDEFSSQIIVPILNNSDYVGGIVVSTKTSSDTMLVPSDIKTVLISGNILANIT